MPSRRPVDPSFSAQVVKQEITKAVAVVRKSLDATRNPQHPADVPHTYDDKFHMVELVSRAALTVQLNTLTNGFALTPEKLKRLQDRRGKKTVTLRMNCSTECTFRETRTREEEAATRGETTGIFGKTTYTSVTTITEHYWDYHVAWAVTAFTGSGGADDFTEALLSREGTHSIMTRSKEPQNPLPEKRAFDPIDVEITWLLDATKTGLVDFTINRSDATQCHTPRRNPEVDGLCAHAATFTAWCSSVHAQVQRTYRDGYASLLPAGEETPNFAVINDEVFLPVSIMLSLEEAGAGDGGDDSGGGGSGGGGGSAAASTAKQFSVADFDAIVAQQQSEMQARMQQIESVLPRGGVVTITEAAVVVAAGYSVRVWRQFNHAVQAVEDMLMEQLIAAIGQRIGPADFAKYMAYHNRQLYLPEFSPRGFCYAVRRPDHYPEGVLSIEDGSDDQPVPTTCLHRPRGHPMKFALSAAVEVAFEGEHLVHAVVFHKFSNSAPPRLSLIARARQFSSFILMVGSLNGADVFAPKHALIIQNKDELKIPLLLETIPAPQEFRDAIESLSPEQQAFCKAYRKMQLAGSLFAVAVVQIKPQLERLLKLPPDALTKEVALCQDLMSLFIEYQIPSDLLAYQGPDGVSGARKLAAVKGYVGAIQAMLTKAKEAELEEERRRVEKANAARLAAQRERERRQQEQALMMRVKRKSARAVPEMRSRSMAMPQRSAPMVASASAASASASVSLRKAAVALAPTPAPAPAPAPTPAPAPAPAPAQQQHQQQQQQGEELQPTDSMTSSGGDDAATVPEDTIDYTQLPSKLDANFDQFDKYNSLRATTIKLGGSWQKTSQRGLLSKPATAEMQQAEQRTERSRAFDLLDALSKSGALALRGCTLHVVVAATHCFDLDLLNTVVQDNINPIDRVEASGLIMASTIFARPPQRMVQDAQAERVANSGLSALNGRVTG